MNSLPKTSVLISVLAFAWSVNSHGQMAVTDPISYTYYIEQINKVTETIKNGKETVATLGDLRGKVNELTAQFRGNYARSLGLVSAIGELYHEVETIPDSIQAGKDEFNSLTGDYEQYFKTDENLRDAHRNQPRLDAV